MLKIIGKRVLVAKQKIDVGGLKLSPETEQDGMKNSAKILQVGQVGLLARLRGVRKGRTVHFRKHFMTNADDANAKVFVYLEDILAVE